MTRIFAYLNLKSRLLGFEKLPHVFSIHYEKIYNKPKSEIRVESRIRIYLAKICNQNLESESKKNWPKPNLESRIRILECDKPESESRIQI